MSESKKRWQVSASKEQRKLGVAEDGWNLAGDNTSISRTRGSTAAAKRKQAPATEIVVPTETVLATAGSSASLRLPTTTDDVSTLTNTWSTSTSRSRSFSPHHLRKPAASRVILDINPLKTMLEMHLSPCPHCRARLIVSFPTVCIASGCQIKCREAHCNFVATCSPEITEFETGGSRKIGRNTDYAANILYVVAFIASGDGGTEAARILGLLGLSNSTTMQS